MTLQEQAINYADEVFESSMKGTWRGLKRTLAEAYVAGATNALANSWHSLKDRDFPQDDNEVLVAYRSEYGGGICYGVAAYYDGEWYTPDDNIYRPGIFAWMQIPTLPNNIINH